MSASSPWTWRELTEAPPPFVAPAPGDFVAPAGSRLLSGEFVDTQAGPLTITHPDVGAGLVFGAWIQWVFENGDSLAQIGYTPLDPAGGVGGVGAIVISRLSNGGGRNKFIVKLESVWS